MSSTEAVSSHNQAISERRLVAWMVLIGFVLRVGFVLVAHTYRFSSAEGSFGFGYEMGRVAASLAEGHGFGNPFKSPTGPTAIVPPLYPFLIAAVFKVTGIYTAASAIVLLTINSLFSALTAAPVFYLAKRTFDARIARWSAWTWTLLPYAMYWAVKWIWETSIAAFLLALLLVLTWRLAETKRTGDWIAWGALWGLAALVNPSELALLPFLGLWVVFRRWRDDRKVIWRAAMSSVVFFAVIAPWLMRNYEVFHRPIFLRSNFGLELRLGNGPGAEGFSMGFVLHPTYNSVELAKYQQMGEIAYVEHQKQEAIDWIKANPGEFVKVSIKRFVYYWTNTPWGRRMMPAKNALFLASSICGFWGLWLMGKQRRPGLFLFASCLIVYPLVYYIVFPHPHYRGPIEPELFTLIVFLVSQTKELQTRWPSRPE
jgi:4-amino-4-deoxy-L-arabinose transferase-like glycosyltransferase